MSDSIKLDSKSVTAPFDPYDLMAYLVPGTSLVVLAKLLKLYPDESFGLIRMIKSLGLESWAVTLIVLLVGFFVCYVIGHVVATLSSLLIDKLFVDGCIGYPSEEQLNLRPEEPQKSVIQFKRRQNYFLLSLLVLAVGTSVFCESQLAWGGLSLFILIRLAYAWRFEHLAAGKQGLSPFEKKFATMVKWVSSPAWIFVDSIRKIFRMDKALPEEVQKEFKKVFKKTIGLNADAKNSSEVFWLSVIWLYENAPEASKNIRHWLKLYAFSRNLSTALLICSLLALGQDKKAVAGWLLATAFAFFVRYLYLYWNYYSKFIFRAIVALGEK